MVGRGYVASGRPQPQEMLGRKRVHGVDSYTPTGTERRLENARAMRHSRAMAYRNAVLTTLIFAILSIKRLNRISDSASVPRAVRWS